MLFEIHSVIAHFAWVNLFLQQHSPGTPPSLIMILMVGWCPQNRVTLTVWVLDITEKCYQVQYPLGTVIFIFTVTNIQEFEKIFVFYSTNICLNWWDLMVSIH